MIKISQPLGVMRCMFSLQACGATFSHVFWLKQRPPLENTGNSKNVGWSGVSVFFTSGASLPPLWYTNLLIINE